MTLLSKIVLPLCLAAAAVAIPLPQSGKRPPKATPTYAVDVAPILNARCVECHRPNDVAPFSLVGYENAKKWSPMITSVTATRRMPPWKAVDGYGDFHDANRLTADEIEALARWNAAGSPRGDRKREPKPPVFSGEWQLGTPDLVLSPGKPFRLDPEGEDVYRNFVLKTDFKEPMYVSAMDVKPGNKRVVHHVIAFVDNGSNAKRLEERQNDGQEGYTTTGGGVGFLPSGAIGGWAPGVRPRRTPEGTAFKIAPGATVVMQVHYHKSGKAEEDFTKLGLYFSKVPVAKEMQLLWALNTRIDIPAGKADYRSERTFSVPRAATLYTVMPHMHLLGREMKAWAELPDGTTRPLVHVDDWDFNWQLVYALREPLKLPAGSKIRVEARYDNSKDNPRQPSDPPRRVTWGEGTNDEMFLLLCAYTVD